MQDTFFVNKKSKGRKKKIYQPREKKYNYLKYWRVIRYYIKNRYKLSDSELDMLLFLYDEDVFDKEKFNDYATLMSWDKRRFSSMVNKGYIKKWRDRKEYNRTNLYELTFTSKRIISHLYKKLMQEEIISENPYRNEIFKGSNYMDKMYKKIIKSMNFNTLTHND